MGGGVVGIGIMGRDTAERLLATGHSVVIWNRTYETAKPVLAAGAGWADSPAEVAFRSQVVITFVTDQAAVNQVTGGPEGIFSRLPDDSVHVDMSTVLPASANKFAGIYEGSGKRFIQAPVLGSKKQITTGELLIFAGGAIENVEFCLPVLESLGKPCWHFGTPGASATAKLACNMLLAHTIVGLGQSLSFAEKGGVDPSTLLEILGDSALASPMIASKGKTIVAGDFRPNFFVKHMEKDLNLAIQAAADVGSDVPLSLAARELFRKAVEEGLGEEDYSAVVKTFQG